MAGLAAVFALLMFASAASASDIVIADNAVLAAGVAVDQSGDVFLAAPADDEVVEAIPDGSGGYTRKVIADTGLSGPTAVAVDGSGDVFVADTGNNRVLVYTPDGSGGYTPSTVDSSVTAPNGVAVDASGDVYIGATGDSDVVVDRPSGGGYTQATVASSLNAPYGVAVDGSGDVFIADVGAGNVQEVQPDGSGGYQAPTVAVSGLSSNYGVAVDGSGNLYTEADPDTLVKETPDGSGGYTQSTVDPGVYYAFGVAVSGSNVYVADPQTQQTFKETPSDCGCYSRTLIDTGVVSPFGIARDRFGDVFIADSGNNRVIEKKPSGGGFTQVLVDDQLNEPGAVAVDGRGDVFIADSGDSRVVVDKPDRHGGYVQSVIDTGVLVPFGVAVDSAGDVFVADTGNSQVVEETPDGHGGYTPAVIDTGFTLNQPFGIAVTGAGNLFIADSGNDRVVEAKADGHGGYTPVVVDDSNVSFPQGVAVDRQGWVFVADTNDDQVLAEKPIDGHYTTASGEYSNAPGGVAVDESDNLFVAESCGCGQVIEQPVSLASVAVKVSPDTSGNYTISATARTPWGERMPSYSDISPTWSDTAGELGSQTPAPFAGGQSVTRNVVMPTPARGVQLSVTTNGITGTSPPFSVPGTVTGFAYKLQKPVTAGQPYTLQVLAVDARGAVVTTYNGSPSWSDLSGQLSGSPAPFSNGVSSNTVTWPTPFHKDRITVTDGSVSTPSNPFNVLGPLARFTFSPDNPVLVNQSFTLRIWAVDALGDVITNYSGSPTWSDLSGSLPPSVPPNPFSGGLSTNTVTLSVPYHKDRITLTDGSVSTQSPPFNVLGAFSKFAFSIQRPVTSGTPFGVLVYAEDSAGNVLPSYSGSPTWSDGSGALSGSPAAFTNGVSSNTVTLPSPFHEDRITVTDGTVTNASGAFNVG